VQRDLGRKAEGVTFLQPSDEPGPLSALKKSQGSISLPARCYPRLKIKIELRRQAGRVTLLDPSDESGPLSAPIKSEGSTSLPARWFPLLKVKMDLKRRPGASPFWTLLTNQVRSRHAKDSQGRVMALALRQKSSKRFQISRPEASPFWNRIRSFFDESGPSSSSSLLSSLELSDIFFIPLEPSVE